MMVRIYLTDSKKLISKLISPSHSRPSQNQLEVWNLPKIDKVIKIDIILAVATDTVLLLASSGSLFIMSS